MDVVITHDHADFDALAGLIAARALYSDAQLVLAPPSGRAVHGFLALHKDHYGLLTSDEVDIDRMTRLVVVDTRAVSRVRGSSRVLDAALDRGLPIEVWDHHPAVSDEIPAAVRRIEPVGAVTTLLVEALREDPERTLDEIDATVMACGIYTDTGSLTFSGTTHRDVAAVAWLLERGARLGVVAHYLRSALTDQQREVLHRLMSSVETREIRGARVGFARTALDRMVPGLGEVAGHLLRMHGDAAMFAIFDVRRGKRVQVIGRARAPWMDLAAVLRPFGGGGHPGAASASLKGALPDQVLEDLSKALEEHPLRPTVVADVMSSPVRTVAPDLPVAVLAESLATWRHTGVPVVRADRLIGIVSCRDVRKARARGQLQLPVSSCMTQEVQTTTPDTTLERAMAIMTRADVGRLPVIEGDLLVGLVSRTDVLNVLYGDAA